MNCLDAWLESLIKKSEKKKEKSPAPWYDAAKAEIGVKEISGKKDNPRVVEYHQSTTLKATDDETPWCSSFVNWCMQKAGYQGTRSATARSWLKSRECKAVKLSDALLGDIVIFQRGNSSWQGHVGFYAGSSTDKIQVLGGNQSNEVNVSSYPKYKLLGVRRPIV